MRSPMGWTGLWLWLEGPALSMWPFQDFLRCKYGCFLPDPFVCRAANGVWLMGAGADYRALSGSPGMQTGVSSPGLVGGQVCWGQWLLRELGSPSGSMRVQMEVSPTETWDLGPSGLLADHDCEGAWGQVEHPFRISRGLDGVSPAQSLYQPSPSQPSHWDGNPVTGPSENQNLMEFFRLTYRSSQTIAKRGRSWFTGHFRVYTGTNICYA